MMVRAPGSALALVVAALAVSSPGASQPPGPDAAGEVPCGRARSDVNDRLHRISTHGTAAVRVAIDDAFVRFRLGRTADAGASLDFALSLLDVTRQRLMTLAERDEARRAITDLRSCIHRSTAPAPAALTVRAYEEDDRVAGGRGAPAPGARVRVEGTLLGQTGPDGVFKGRVPSGSIRVTAGLPPSEAGEALVDLPPGSAGEVSITLESSKDVTEPTPVVVVEAEGGILPATTRTLTLKFLDGTGSVKVGRIDAIDLLGPDSTIIEELAQLFMIEGDAIVAVDAEKAIGKMRRGTALVLLAVEASAGELVHASRVEFRIH